MTIDLAQLPKAAGRFWAKVDRGDSCWEWTGYIMPEGYGQIGVGKTVLLTHRFSWMLHNGVPRGHATPTRD